MTGASSGIGKSALNYLRREKETMVITGSRTKIPEGLFVDLANLDSVRKFADRIISQAGQRPIDALVLNAGMQISGESRSADGYELTFAVNHLAHYLLIRLLRASLADGAVILMTSSGTYDPAEKTIIPPPLHADAMLLAHPEKDPQHDNDPIVAGGRAYSSSKLCVMLTVLALNGDPDLKKRGIRAIAFDPGPTPGTGLVRGRGPLIVFLWKLLGMPLLRNVFKGSNSVDDAGKALAALARGGELISGKCHYAALRRGKMTYPPLSDLAGRTDLAEKLWNDSAVLCGLSGLRGATS